MVTALLECPVDTHEHGLQIGALLAAVGVAVLADDYGRSNHPLGVVVVERNLGVIEKREQLLGMTPQTLDQSAGVGVLPGVRDQLLHIAMLYEKLALIAISEPVARAPSPQAL